MARLPHVLRLLVRSPQFLLYGGGVVLFIFSGWLWWTAVHGSAAGVFWGMLDNSLQTSAVQKTAHQVGNGQTLDQKAYFAFNKQTLIQNTTTIKQSDGSLVRTSNVSTPSDEYVRYDKISTNQKSATGQPIDTSGLTGIWALSKASDFGQSGTPYAKSLLGVTQGNWLPIANVSAAARSSLLRQLKNNTAFTTDFKVAKRIRVDGRPAYVYDVKIQPVGYVAFEKAFARSLGIKLLDDVDPNQYQGQAAISLKLTVDARAQRLIRIDYGAATSTTAHTETYQAYNVPHTVAIPVSKLTTAELQQRLQGL